MSRLTQYISYINADKAPTGDEIKFFYTDITIYEKLKRERFLYRLKLNKLKKNK
jgi:hypothetical protein